MSRYGSEGSDVREDGVRRRAGIYPRGWWGRVCYVAMETRWVVTKTDCEDVEVVYMLERALKALADHLSETRSDT